MRRVTGFTLLLASVVLTACDAAPAEGPRVPRRVFLVLLDSVRVDRTAAGGASPSRTPRLDALAREGVAFERAYAASSNTLQSLSGLWTGRLPTSGGSTGLREATPHPSLLTLPRAFLRAGYRTALVSNQPALRERAFTRGFDDVEVDSERGRWSAGHVVRTALELVDAAGDEPLFLTLVLGDAAEPHLPSAEQRDLVDVPAPPRLLSLDEVRAGAGALPDDLRTSPGFLDLVARYDAEVAFVDACLGLFVDGIAHRGLASDALTIVTSPHGVELLEHGYVGSGWTLYDEVTRVPLVLHAPGRLRPGRVSAPASLVDLLPGLVRLLGQAEADLIFDGTPMLTAGAGGALEVHAAGEALGELVVPELAVLRAAVVGDRKRIECVRWIPPADRPALAAGFDALVTAMQAGEVERPDALGAAERVELYDLAADPGEVRDLVDASPKRANELADRLARYLEACRRHGLEPRTPVRAMEMPEPGELEELQQLGYL